jgi:hypothetical protein
MTKITNADRKKADMKYSDLVIMIRRLAQKDCGSNSCQFGGRLKGGMRTNGSCSCADGLAHDILEAIRKL